MTPQEALKKLDDIVQEAKLTRYEHSRASLAVRTLHDVIIDNQKRKDGGTKDE